MTKKQKSDPWPSTSASAIVLDRSGNNPDHHLILAQSYIFNVGVGNGRRYDLFPGNKAFWEWIHREGYFTRWLAGASHATTNAGGYRKETKADVLHLVQRGWIAGGGAFYQRHWDEPRSVESLRPMTEESIYCELHKRFITTKSNSIQPRKKQAKSVWSKRYGGAGANQQGTAANNHHSKPSAAPFGSPAPALTGQEDAFSSTPSARQQNAPYQHTGLPPPPHFGYGHGGFPPFYHAPPPVFPPPPSPLVAVAKTKDETANDKDDTLATVNMNTLALVAGLASVANDDSAMLGRRRDGGGGEWIELGMGSSSKQDALNASNDYAIRGEWVEYGMGSSRPKKKAATESETTTTEV